MYNAIVRKLPHLGRNYRLFDKVTIVFGSIIWVYYYILKRLNTLFLSSLNALSTNLEDSSIYFYCQDKFPND